MDLHEWELLSDASFIDLHENKVVNNSISPKSTVKNTTVIDVDYLQKSTEQQKKGSLSVIPVPIKFDQEENFEEIPEDITKLPIESSQEIDDHQMKDQKSDDQEMTSKVFFKKLKENEFVDMKMDTPKSLNMGILPQIDVGTYQFDQKVEKDENFDKETPEKDEKLIAHDEKNIKMEDDSNWEDDEHGGVKIWKWAMTGMGALVTFGFAAATVSLIVFSNRQKEINHSKKQELHFQIYSHDKRFKQVVRRAKKLNEAISVMRGAPMTRAHITIGGNYEAL